MVSTTMLLILRSIPSFITLPCASTSWSLFLTTALWRECIGLLVGGIFSPLLVCGVNTVLAALFEAFFLNGSRKTVLLSNVLSLFMNFGKSLLRQIIHFIHILVQQRNTSHVQIILPSFILCSYRSGHHFWKILAHLKTWQRLDFVMTEMGLFFF